MKLFVATFATLAAAQDAGDDSRTFSFGDDAFASYGSYGDSAFGSASFYDSAYGSDYGDLSAVYDGDDAAAAADADAAVADEAGRDKDEARYFGTTAAGTTTTPGTPGTTTTHESDSYCIKCDVMSPTDCVAAAGNREICNHGDVCFLEVRRNNPRAPSNTKVLQICTGCKAAQSCFDLKDQNAVVGAVRHRELMQCYPMKDEGTNRPRLGEAASVCRTCFEPSAVTTISANNFFTGVTATSFTIPDGTGSGSTTFNLYTSTQAQFESFWFTSTHGLTIGEHGLDFALAYP